MFTRCGLVTPLVVTSSSMSPIFYREPCCSRVGMTNSRNIFNSKPPVGRHRNDVRRFARVAAGARHQEGDRGRASSNGDRQRSAVTHGHGAGHWHRLRRRICHGYVNPRLRSSAPTINANRLMLIATADNGNAIFMLGMMNAPFRTGESRRAKNTRGRAPCVPRRNCIRKWCGHMPSE